MKDFEHILLFRTNIKSREDIKILKTLLDLHDKIEQWNVDLNDEDYVLRIVSHNLSHQEIIELVNLHGYECAELQ